MSVLAIRVRVRGRREPVPSWLSGHCGLTRALPGGGASMQFRALSLARMRIGGAAFARSRGCAGMMGGPALIG